MSHERSPHLQDDPKSSFRVRTDVLDAKAAAKAQRDAAFTAGLRANAEERPRGSRVTVPVEAPAVVVEVAPEAPPAPPPVSEPVADPVPVEAPAPAPRVRSGRG